jgi:hypothetical protein
MDPFDSKTLHEDVYCYITQHLDGKDVLAISEVSTTWNQIAENKIGDKVHLKLDLDSMKAKDFSTITQTSRAYKKVSLESDNNARVNAICELSTHAEEMEISVIRREEQESFPNLKVLDLTVAAGEDSWILKSRMNQLEKLKLNVQYNHWTGSEDLSHVHEFLEELIHLKHLDVSGCDFDVLDTLITSTPFRLEYLKASLQFATPFLDSHRKHLKSFIPIGRCCRSMIRFILVDFPELEKLEITACHCFATADENYQDNPRPINTKIKDLTFHCFDHNVEEYHDQSVIRLVSSLPALVSLDIEWLSTESIEFIATNLQKLEKLSYRNVSDGALERYQQMKLDEVEKINKNIHCEMN